MSENELEIKRQELEIRERNLKAMQDLYEHNKNLTDTQHIDAIASKLFDKIEKKGHVCFQGERLKNIESSLDKIEVGIDKLYEGRNKNSERITVLEAQKNTVIWIVGIMAPILGGIAGLIVDKITK